MIVTVFRSRLAPGGHDVLQRVPVSNLHRRAHADLGEQSRRAMTCAAPDDPTDPSQPVVTPEVIERHRRLAHALRHQAIRSAVRRCGRLFVRSLRALRIFVALERFIV
ncbi:MAG: hypothetical protein HZA66_02470 [Rhodopseudomonas palustris]|uniref:Uncharacterized protein n=1 Tax=Rhodopseudomonas palustris TaxID=1076 RepID=A0A933VT41_RHOPL|nr:hypothetical protein [Rhodopseudomonas palustris]